MELVLMNCGWERNQESNIWASLDLPATSAYQLKEERRWTRKQKKVSSLDMMEMSVCRIYVPNDHKVILSRDVQFQERIVDCISKGKLPMKNIENEDQVDEEEDRPNEQKTDTEGKSEINSEGSQKLRKVSRGDEKYKTRN
jgi:hypothetical protein